MTRNLLAFLVVALIAAPLSSAAAARNGRPWGTASRGDLLVTFSGGGGGAYRFHEPATGGLGLACRTPDTGYVETDSYSWSFSFIVPAGGGGSAVPVSQSASGLLGATERTATCAGTPATTGICTQPLHVPSPTNAADLAYPAVNVVASAHLVTVGALAELVRGSAAPSCTGIATLVPNRVQGYGGLQATVSFPRGRLTSTGDARASVTMAGAGLYSDVALSATCNSASCDTTNCQQDLPAGSGQPPSCTYAENYTGTIEVRILR